jgi:hypothetical protein
MPPNMTKRCIYCQETKPEEGFRRKEHVIPQSFGRFRDNLTLTIVCDECNQYFGDNLELSLARDTFEGHSRFEHGVKDADQFRPFGKSSRIVIRMTEGPFAGAYAYREYNAQEDRIVLEPLPQIGFRSRNTDTYGYFLLDEIPGRSELVERGFDTSKPDSIRSLALAVEEVQRQLEAKGIGFEYGGEVVSRERAKSMLCEVEGQIDGAIFRAIAKIAFNYLAYWQGEVFVGGAPFDAARRFIRYGTQAGYQLVLIRQEAILEDEPVEGRRRLGHLITVNWAGDNVSILGQVSLFNWITYRVSLARDVQGERRDIAKGSFFNVANGEILELGHRSKERQP